MKKLTPILALALLASTLLTACAGSSDDGASDTTTAGATSSEATTEYVEPDRDFEGEDFTIWYRNDGYWALTDIYVENENGDIINDAVYERNLEVETRFNVNYVGVPSQTVGTDGTDTKVLSSLILSGEDAYNVIVPASYTAASLILSKMLIDFNTIPNIDLDNSWWDQNIRRTMSVKNKQFVMSSDISVINTRDAVAVYFNRDIAKSLGIDSDAVFESAKNGTWTFDYMIQTGKPATMDLNGDGIMDENDRYAFLNSINSSKNLATAVGAFVTGKNDDDSMAFVLDNERSISALTHLINDIINIDDTFSCPSDSEKMRFIAGSGMFAFLNVINLENLRAEELNFSVLPMPKYNEDQEAYYCQAPSWGTSLLAVPITTKNLDLTGYILEKTSEISSRTLIPAFYDVAITTKYSRDEESIEMLDIIFDSIVHEPADMFRFANITNGVKTIINDGGNIASFIESNKSAVIAAIDELNDTVA